MRGGTIPAARLLHWPSGRGRFLLHGAGHPYPGSQSPRRESSRLQRAFRCLPRGDASSFQTAYQRRIHLAAARIVRRPMALLPRYELRSWGGGTRHRPPDARAAVGRPWPGRRVSVSRRAGRWSSSSSARRSHASARRSLPGPLRVPTERRQLARLKSGLGSTSGEVVGRAKLERVSRRRGYTPRQPRGQDGGARMGSRRRNSREDAELGRRLAASARYAVRASDGRDVGFVEHVRYERHAEHPDEIVIAQRRLLRRDRRTVPFSAVESVEPRARTVSLRIDSANVRQLPRS
jgi:hypothetical protein